jgi:SAM-dependent methyltransferase
VLAERFRNAIGVDPSSAMIDKATAQNKMANVKYIASAAEELPDIKDNSIDLVTAGRSSPPEMLLSYLYYRHRKGKQFIGSTMNDYGKS